MTNERFKESQEPIIQNADLNRELDQELSRYSMGYLRHLFTVNEVLGMRLATLVNLRFYLELMERIRTAIENDRL